MQLANAGPIAPFPFLRTKLAGIRAAKHAARAAKTRGTQRKKVLLRTRVRRSFDTRRFEIAHFSKLITLGSVYILLPPTTNPSGWVNRLRERGAPRDSILVALAVGTTCSNECREPRDFRVVFPRRSSNMVATALCFGRSARQSLDVVVTPLNLRCSRPHVSCGGDVFPHHILARARSRASAFHSGAEFCHFCAHRPGDTLPLSGFRFAYTLAGASMACRSPHPPLVGGTAWPVVSRSTRVRRQHSA